MSEIEIEESNGVNIWQNYAKIFGINISQESQIVDDKATYSLILQNLGYFEEMAEKMVKINQSLSI